MFFDCWLGQLSNNLNVWSNLTWNIYTDIRKNNLQTLLCYLNSLKNAIIFLDQNFLVIVFELVALFTMLIRNLTNVKEYALSIYFSRLQMRRESYNNLSADLFLCLDPLAYTLHHKYSNLKAKRKLREFTMFYLGEPL